MTQSAAVQGANGEAITSPEVYARVDFDADAESAPLLAARRRGRSPLALLIVVVGLLGSLAVGQWVTPTWSLQQTPLDVHEDASGALVAVSRGATRALGEATAAASAALSEAAIAQANRDREAPAVTEQVVFEETVVDGRVRRDYLQLSAARHFGAWSLLPAALAIGLCLSTKEPITALLAGVVSGALILGEFNVVEAVLLPSLASPTAAGILLLYLWLLGGLMGVWARTGAAHAFARFMTDRFVRGPRSAKFVAWLLGIVFFQGGTMSTVLVGTAVRPIGDAQRVSHEELSYIVDSTASPVASLLAFNAWPAYVAALILLPGVGFLGTETDRIAFFFACVPLCFYSLFAVTGTLLLCFDRLPFIGPGMKQAMRRARETGELDAPGAMPLSSKELETAAPPAGYTPHAIDFFLPLALLIGIAVVSFAVSGSPEVRWAFAAALLLAAAMAMGRGMSLMNVMDGIGQGLKGVVVASVVLLLAVTIGGITSRTGGGLYLVEQLSGAVPYYLLPAALVALTVVIAFATGTSWGTYAVAFPLAMPLAWAVAGAADLEHPRLYLMICFAAVLNGSVFGDQCSPISDTTILSSMTTGADLMDHVRTQLYPASVAMGLAVVCWTLLTVVAV